MNPTSAWLLLAAVLVGFAAAWLAFEIRRAWSPESLRSTADARPAAPGEPDAPTDTIPALVEQVAQLRREITAVRAAEIETALRVRQRELQREQAAEATTTPTPTGAEPKLEVPPFRSQPSAATKAEQN